MGLHKKIEKMIFLSNVCQTAILQKSSDNTASAIKYRLVVTALAVCALALGCDRGSEKSLFDQAKLLGQENTELKLQVEKLQGDNEELTKRVKTLTSIGPDVRLEVLGRLESIEISSRSGLYDKDKDGTKESLVVYVRTIDDAGDAIKAAGSVEVQLWDLEAQDNARLAEWRIKPEELKVLWSSTVMTSYYRLTFDVSELLADNEKELTVKVTFTDYITGNTLRKQKVIQP